MVNTSVPGSFIVRFRAPEGRAKVVACQGPVPPVAVQDTALDVFQLMEITSPTSRLLGEMVKLLITTPPGGGGGGLVVPPLF